MKIYTKTGDAGTTSLIGGKRVKKNNLRIESYGTVDELNSYIGLIKDQKGIGNNDKNSLLKIQNELFTIGAMLATDPDKETLKNGQERVSIPKIDRHSILFLENEIDKMDEKLPQMTHFILPGAMVFPKPSLVFPSTSLFLSLSASRAFSFLASSSCITEKLRLRP